MKKLYILERILSKFTYVHKLREAVGEAYAKLDMVAIHGQPCCEHECLYKAAYKFLEKHREFEDLAYNKNEWSEWDIHRNNFLG